MKPRTVYLLFPIILITMIGCKQPVVTRQTTDLSGTWQFALDTNNSGINEKWYSSDLHDSIELPGTTDLGKKGIRNTDTTTMHLNRLYRYEGPAWYRRKVIIPEDFNNKHIVLSLERTKPSMVWVNDVLAGKSMLLQSAQVFDISEYLKPGENTITIRIDNSLRLTPYGNVHIYSDDTQTNWNGIIGKIFLEASPVVHISDLQVHPDVNNRKFQVFLKIAGAQGQDQIPIEINLRLSGEGMTKKLKKRNYSVRPDSLIRLEYSLGPDMKLWDEYHRNIYGLTVKIGEGLTADSRTVTFGMRDFTVKGTKFNINGRDIFLRGKHDACVFPLTGFPPMETEGWIRVFQKAKSYGINHYRFHSWCPPEAAFIAADREGIYLQPEVPFWGGLESDSVALMLREEGIAMLRSYANHPSFVLFSHGNEIWSGHDRVEKNILSFIDYDDRPLYTMGSNNNIGYAVPRACSDFFVAARTPYSKDTTLTHTRLTHAFADSRDGGILNTQQPSTTVRFDYAVSQINMPVIGHEIGQYQIYPDFNEIEKYNGVLKAWNLDVFRERLEKSGMMDQNEDFHKASGAWAALCYKAEMEAALRTEGFGGFQLLDLQDFPGQGTALVGILDAFMDDKGIIERTEWINSCNDVVILLEFSKYCWTNSETFAASVKVANYSGMAIPDDLLWTITNHKGEVIAKGTLGRLSISTGVHEIGKISITLNKITLPEKCSLKVSLKSSGYSNQYPLWIYPPPSPVQAPKEIYISENLDQSVLTRLHNGGKVLLFPSETSVKNNSVKGLFPPEFWNYGMFKGISEWVKKPVSPGTLGILTDPEHPVFNSFSTDFHTNWQWFSIIKASNPLILNKTPLNYRPIVQVIDNLERNHKFGLIFEFAVGQGKLLVCMSRLTEILDKPEAFALYQSILNYMESDAFNPAYTADAKLLSEILN